MAFAVLSTAGIGALTANAGSAGEQQIRVSYSGFNAERVKTIPIAKTSGRKCSGRNPRQTTLKSKCATLKCAIQRWPR